MKKLLIIFSVFVAGSSLVSCNKKLKDDISDLKSQVTDLKSQNDTLKNSLGSDEPITAVTTFGDSTGNTRTVTGVYKFKSSDYYTQRALKNADGTYDIYIERFSDVAWEEGVQAGFTYNPATKAVTKISVYQYWSDNDPYYDNARYYSTYTGPGLTLNLTVDNFDTTTGAISMKFAASGTSDYTKNVTYYYVPMTGKPVSTNFTFTGKLKIFTKN